MLILSPKEEPCQICDRRFTLREMTRGELERFVGKITEIDKLSKRYQELHAAGKGDSPEGQQLKAESGLLTKPLFDACLRPLDPPEHPTADWYEEHITERMGSAIIEKQLELNGYAELLGKLQPAKAAQEMAADLQHGPRLPAPLPESTS